MKMMSVKTVLSYMFAFLVLLIIGIKGFLLTYIDNNFSELRNIFSVIIILSWCLFGLFTSQLMVRVFKAESIRLNKELNLQNVYLCNGIFVLSGITIITGLHIIYLRENIVPFTNLLMTTGTCVVLMTVILVYRIITKVIANKRGLN